MYCRDEQVQYCGADPNCYISYDWNDKLKYAFIYHFFGLLWTNQFIVGFACVTIAGAIASYYWCVPVAGAVLKTVSSGFACRWQWGCCACL